MHLKRIFVILVAFFLVKYLPCFSYFINILKPTFEYTIRKNKRGFTILKNGCFVMDALFKIQKNCIGKYKPLWYTYVDGFGGC